MDEYTQHLVKGARATYEDVLTGKSSRITRGDVLYSQFEDAVRLCDVDQKKGDSQLREKVNELAVAKILADDKGLRGAITYEPNILPSGRKIDFVAERLRDN